MPYARLTRSGLKGYFFGYFDTENLYRVYSTNTVSSLNNLIEGLQLTGHLNAALNTSRHNLENENAHSYLSITRILGANSNQPQIVNNWNIACVFFYPHWPYVTVKVETFREKGTQFGQYSGITAVIIASESPPVTGGTAN